MSNPSGERRFTVPEEQAYAEAKELFADYLNRFTSYREAVERLERNLSIMAQAATIAATGSPSGDDIIQMDDGMQWHRDVALMESIYLCHRLLTGEAEYAVVEHFPERGRHEIWNRGGKAGEVVRVFAQEQRNALQVWAEDLTEQVREFLVERYPGQDLGHLAESFMHRFAQAVPLPTLPSEGQNHTHEART